MRSALGILTGLGLGAAAMYLFDPQGGRRRRALIRDKAVSINRRTQDAVRGGAVDLSNRAKGLLHETKSAFSGESSPTSEPQQYPNS